MIRMAAAGFHHHLLMVMAVLTTTPALGAEIEEGAFFGFGLMGGTAATATVLAEKEARRAAPGFSAGIAEVAFGFRGASGFGGALTGQSLDFQGLGRNSRLASNWSGEALGLTGSWRYRRLTLAASVLGGSIRPRSGSDWQEGRYSHTVFGGKAGFDFALYKGDWMDLSLIGALEPLLVDGDIHADELLGRRIYAQQIGLGMSFYPQAMGAGGTSTTGSFSAGCYGCGDSLLQGGKLLLDVGSALGRATASGLFHILSRR